MLEKARRNSIELEGVRPKKKAYGREITWWKIHGADMNVLGLLSGITEQPSQIYKFILMQFSKHAY